MSSSGASMPSSGRHAGAAARHPSCLRDCLRAMRPHQWVKNLLVFVPLAAMHGLLDATRVLACLGAFAAFSLGASSVYIFNDLMDLPEDQSRPQTAGRPIANGRVRAREAIALQLLLLLAAGVIGWQLPHGFLWILGTYYLLMCLYSVALKRIVVLDIVTLASGYSLRVAAGAAVVHVHPSAWLIALCGSLFMSLALLKRYAELMASAAVGNGDAALRGYRPSDAPILAAQGIAAGYVTVLVLALYTTTTDLVSLLYRRPQLFWLLCALLLYWINYMWLMARRGRVPHDPVVFALQDRTSLLLIILMGAVALLAV